MINDELFIDTLAAIERSPESWRQETWRCESGMCFAGWAAELANTEYLWCDSYSGWMSRPGAGLDDVVHCSAVASYALGLSGDIGSGVARHSMLFGANNSLDTLYSLSAERMGVTEDVLRDKVRDRLTEAR